MSKFWSRHLSDLSAYTAGEQPQDRSYIKLNTNENPYPASTKIIETIRQFTADELRLYPDPQSRRLKQTIAEHFGLEETNIFVGNGSDEVLAHAFMAFFKQIYPVYFPDISYSFYPVFCGYFGIEYQTVPLTSNFSIDLEKFPETNGGIIFANPNAPTGMFIEPSDIETLLQMNQQSVVIIDEAYIDFGGSSCLSLITRYPNILVVQTTSKSRSLAGLRVGYALGPSELLEGLNIAKDSFNSYPIDCIAEAAAIAAFNDQEYFESCRERIIHTREWTNSQLAVLSFEVLPSKSNFLMIKHPDFPAEKLYQALKEKGILVRYFASPRVKGYIRLSIGTQADMETFIKIVTGIIQL